MKYVAFGSDEMDAMQGLPWLAQMIYLRAMLPYVDRETLVVGIKRGISYAGIRDDLYVERPPGSKVKDNLSTAVIRHAIEQLIDAGLLKRKSDGRRLIFLLPLALVPSRVQNRNNRTDEGERHSTGSSSKPNNSWRCGTISAPPPTGGTAESSDTLQYINKNNQGESQEKNVRGFFNSYAGAREKNEKRPKISPDWQPSEAALRTLDELAVPSFFVRQMVPKHVLYWTESEHQPISHNSKFVEHCQRMWLASMKDQKPMATSGGYRGSNADAVEEAKRQHRAAQQAKQDGYYANGQKRDVFELFGQFCNR